MGNKNHPWEINFDTDESEILEFCKKIPNRSGELSTEKQDLYLSYGLGLLNIKHQKKLIEDQNKGTGDLVRWTKVLAIGTVILAVITVIFSFIQNKSGSKEFEIRNRPYIVVDNIEGNTDLNSTRSDYRVLLKNSGIIPARISYQVMKCTGINQDNLAFSTSTPESNTIKSDLIEPSGLIAFPFSLTGIREAKCNFDIKYYSAVSDFSQKEYETQQDINYKFGTQVSSSGGFMN